MRRIQVARLLRIPLLLLLFHPASAADGKRPMPKVRKVDIYVVGETSFVPGSRASLRVVTQGATDVAHSVPIPLALVTASLNGEKQRKILFRGRADLLGNVAVRFRVPAWPDGRYEMRVRSQTLFGDEELRQAVDLKRKGKILLVSDKPIYQPRQPMHLRALALSTHDLKPLRDEAIRFEIQDSKGNKVFKKKLTTDGYGVAHARFQLADEINLGAYQIEAAAERKDVAEPVQKTVVVNKYVLPKFKVQIDTDRAYYLPKQTIKGSIRADYFFGKPVAGGQIEVKASTFDVAFREFAHLRGRTGQDGRWAFELRLPDRFVGQPITQGDAVVKLEVKLTDTAKHVEKSVKTVALAAEPIRLTAAPEGGRLVVGVENQIFVVATYPDSSPARATVVVKRSGEPIGEIRTDETGLGLFALTPRVEDMRDGGWQPRGRFGRDRRRYAVVQPKHIRSRLLDLQFEARDERGNRYEMAKTFSTDPAGDRVLLRTDKAIYASGDTVRATVLTAEAGNTCYLDLIKNRQTLLTRTVALTEGAGHLKLALDPEAFGSIELHAYMILKNGDIVRDGRVVYVQPASQLSIGISRDKPVYRPGGQALFQFRVVDAQGQPARTALGIIIVDEAVYALQELQPGLEKVYFTLEKELSDPKHQIELGPADSLATLVKAERIREQKQRVAKALLAKAEPVGDPKLWSNPVVGRFRKARQDLYALRSALYRWAQHHPLGRKTKQGRYVYRQNLVQEMIAGKVFPKQRATDLLGAPYTMKTAAVLWPKLAASAFLARLELGRLWELRSRVFNHLYERTSGFTKLATREMASEMAVAFAAALGHPSIVKRDVAGQPYRWKAIKDLPGFRLKDMLDHPHGARVGRIYYAMSRYGQEGERWYRVSVLDKRRDAYDLPKDILRRLNRKAYLSEEDSRDVWERPFQLKKLERARERVLYNPRRRSYKRLRFYVVYSLGPDGKAGTDDDLEYPYPLPMPTGGYQQLAEHLGCPMPPYVPSPGSLAVHRASTGGSGIGGIAPQPTQAPAAVPKEGALEERAQAGPQDAPAAPKTRQVRVREYFPETLLFAPALITDDNGEATLKVPMADSITTWRMTASANGWAGGLGSTGHGIRVFQDFFVDLDLPVSLTQHDEVSIPVVVYNYLKGRQRVRLELTRGDWFELSGQPVQEMDIAPGEVAATYYRIRVTGLGRRMLEVRANGSQMSDAIRREIEVLPDGKERNLAHNGRLQGTVVQTVDIPPTAVPGASKILVRLYPGVFSQIIEGMESMLRLPGG